jgi:hypothetical protein
MRVDEGINPLQPGAITLEPFVPELHQLFAGSNSETTRQRESPTNS